MRLDEDKSARSHERKIKQESKRVTMVEKPSLGCLFNNMPFFLLFAFKLGM